MSANMDLNQYQSSIVGWQACCSKQCCTTDQSTGSVVTANYASVLPRSERGTGWEHKSFLHGVSDNSEFEETLGLWHFGPGRFVFVHVCIRLCMLTRLLRWLNIEQPSTVLINWNFRKCEAAAACLTLSLHTRVFKRLKMSNNVCEKLEFEKMWNPETASSANYSSSH